MKIMKFGGTSVGSIERIEQVAVNLLVNACQALNGPDQPIAARTFYDEVKKAVCIRVSDGGENRAAQ